MLQSFLKSINPSSPDLIYGQKYSLFKGGKNIGIATWVKDKNIGDSFQTVGYKNKVTVYIPDRWELIN